MQKVLRKRVLREFRENLFRYIALFLLIVLGMYLVVSLVAAAESILVGTDRFAKQQKVESGEFHVFVPLKKEQEKELEDKGITLEKTFYLDFSYKNGKHVRVFQNREKMNLVDTEQGKKTSHAGEMVLEKRFCESNKIKTGDTFTLAGKRFKVTGIGIAPDYEAPKESFADSSVDSKQFGVAFVTKEEYQKLLKTKKSIRSEEYVYAYRLNGKMTNKALKEKLKTYEVSADSISDPYFQKYWNDTGAKKDKLLDGVNKLADGAADLGDGMEKLSKYRKRLLSVTKLLLSSSLREAQEGFASYGLEDTLTEQNFEQKLKALKAKSDNGIVNLKIGAVIDQLKGIKQYKDAIDSYTKAVNKAADGSEKLAKGTAKLQDNLTSIVDRYFDFSLNNLKQFVTQSDNSRIGAAGDDQILNKYAGLVSGVIILILFAYVISVFVIHGIERESSVIGALYALGVTKNDLIRHYLMLPAILTFAASVAGFAVGMCPLGAWTQMQDCYAYFSICILPVCCPLYLVIYVLFMPVITTIIVNYLVIRKHLSQTVLSLMRKEEKQKKIHAVSLKGMRFVTRFQIRQMLKEMRTGFTVLFGMFISLLIVMLSLDCLVMCNAIRDESKQDTKYEYMYSYKYPTSKVPEGGTEYFAKGFTKVILGYKWDITMLGVGKNDPYFPANVTKSKKNVVISSAFAQKNNLHVGDSLVLSDEEEDMDYAFCVQDIMQYSTGMYVFMDIDSMRDLFGEEDDYYNIVCSDKKLSIPGGRLDSITTKKQVEEASAVFSDMMGPMIGMLCGVSAIIFVVVMYLMLKVMIDRSSFPIALMQIFGYRTKEIRKLYLNGNFYIVAIGGIFCMTLAKVAMDRIYPFLVVNVATRINLTFGWKLYAGVYAAIILLYFVINHVLVGKIRKITPAEILKNRE